MKRFIKLAFIILTSIGLVTSCSSTLPIAVAYQIVCDDMSYGYQDRSTLLEKIEAENLKMEAAHQMAESARFLGYEETHEVIQLAQKEWEQAYNQMLAYQQAYDDLNTRWKMKESEYPSATYIWSYFKDLGYSDYVCAGIMGNLMAEVGGQTLALQYKAQGNGYYGMCQWNKAYKDVWGASLEEQCAFLQATIKYEIDTYGYAYKKGFNYESFLALTDCQQVALVFAKCYERCGSGSHKVRKNNAIAAYNYFVS